MNNQAWPLADQVFCVILRAITLAVFIIIIVYLSIYFNNKTKDVEKFNSPQLAPHRLSSSQRNDISIKAKLIAQGGAFVKQNKK